jgi:hypothetical protein
MAAAADDFEPCMPEVPVILSKVFAPDYVIYALGA